MSPTYTWTTFGAVVQELANRLYDPGQNFWSPAELQAYIQESLQTWNALTNYWRGDFVFPATPPGAWYDLTEVPNSLRPYTMTDASLYPLIQWHLLEPATGVDPWVGNSAQYTTDDLVNAVQRRRDETISTTGCTVTRLVVPASGGRILLPDTTLDVRRVAIILPGTGTPYGAGLYGAGPYGGISTVSILVLWPEDTWGEQSFNTGYIQQPPGTPSTWLMNTEPPISFDTDRIPGGGSEYEVLVVQAGQLCTPSTPTLLEVPNDWAHVIKWGALADLYARESNAKDSLRASYCEQRYRMGLSLLANASSLLAMRVLNTPLQIDSVRGADLYNTSWESQALGTPSDALVAGTNLIAVTPPPNSANQFTATVVANAPLPSILTDPVQVGRDDLDVIIDYAQHIAALKMGGAEFLATMPLLKRFLTQAAIYGLKLSELAEYTSVLYSLGQREESMNPRLAGPIEVASGSEL